MNMQEATRLINALRALGLDDTKILDLLLYVESGGDMPKKDDGAKKGASKTLD